LLGPNIFLSSLFSSICKFVIYVLPSEQAIIFENHTEMAELLFCISWS